MMHPNTELRFISEEIGYGVVAMELIPKGSITWVQDELDQIIKPERVAAMAPDLAAMVEKYSFRNKEGNFVLCWDLSKYVNHSFNSNCLSTAYDFEIAIRDIQPGEQLTDDYGYLNLTEPFQAEDEGLERSVVYPDDLLRYYEQWDRKIDAAAAELERVDQPLWGLVPDAFKRIVLEKLRKAEPLDSILGLYYSGG